MRSRWLSGLPIALFAVFAIIAANTGQSALTVGCFVFCAVADTLILILRKTK